MKVLQWVLWLLGLSLQSLLLAALTQGGGRQFPPLFAYVLCLLATTIAEIVAYVSFGKASSAFGAYYWSAELIRQTALFALVVSLAAHIMPTDGKGEVYGRWITISAVGIWAGSLLLYYDPDLNTWMTTVARNLSFFTGILNLFVWFAYARTKSSDITRLMIAAGLGLQMTGAAIGQAIRLMNYSKGSKLAGALLMVFSHMICLFIWWRAFRMEERTDDSDDDPDGGHQIGLGSLETRSSLLG
jgi:hypothetical protein